MNCSCQTIEYPKYQNCVLTSLYLKCKYVSTLPNANSPKLEILCLPANNMVSISPDMFASNNWKALRILMLAINKITHLPPNLFSSSSLERLEYTHVAYNDLTELPEGLGYQRFQNNVLQKLRKIDLGYNEIEHIPAKFLPSVWKT